MSGVKEKLESLIELNRNQSKEFQLSLSDFILDQKGYQANITAYKAEGQCVEDNMLKSALNIEKQCRELLKVMETIEVKKFITMNRVKVPADSSSKSIFSSTTGIENFILYKDDIKRQKHSKVITYLKSANLAILPEPNLTLPNIYDAFSLARPFGETLLQHEDVGLFDILSSFRDKKPYTSGVSSHFSIHSLLLRLLEIDTAKINFKIDFNTQLLEHIQDIDELDREKQRKNEQLRKLSLEFDQKQQVESNLGGSTTKNLFFDFWSLSAERLSENKDSLKAEKPFVVKTKAKMMSSTLMEDRIVLRPEVVKLRKSEKEEEKSSLQSLIKLKFNKEKQQILNDIEAIFIRQSDLHGLLNTKRVAAFRKIYAAQVSTNLISKRILTRFDQTSRIDKTIKQLKSCHESYREKKIHTDDMLIKRDDVKDKIQSAKAKLKLLVQDERKVLQEVSFLEPSRFQEVSKYFSDSVLVGEDCIQPFLNVPSLDDLNLNFTTEGEVKEIILILLKEKCETNKLIFDLKNTITIFDNKLEELNQIMTKTLEFGHTLTKDCFETFYEAFNEVHNTMMILETANNDILCEKPFEHDLSQLSTSFNNPLVGIDKNIALSYTKSYKKLVKDSESTFTKQYNVKKEIAEIKGTLRILAHQKEDLLQEIKSLLNLKLSATFQKVTDSAIKDLDTSDSVRNIQRDKQNATEQFTLLENQRIANLDNSKSKVNKQLDEIEAENSSLRLKQRHYISKLNTQRDICKSIRTKPPKPLKNRKLSLLLALQIKKIKTLQRNLTENFNSN